MGNPRDTYFWENQRAGDGALSTVFPYLYHLSSLKNCPISDFVFDLRTLFLFPLDSVLICPIG